MKLKLKAVGISLSMDIWATCHRSNKMLWQSEAL